MYIIIDILGNQYKIFKGLKIKINMIKYQNNSIVILNKILFFSSSKYFIIEKYFLNKIVVLARILKHKKLKKINILKFKRRKGYKKKIGFRKFITELFIENIFLSFLEINGSKKIRRFF